VQRAKQMQFVAIVKGHTPPLTSPTPNNCHLWYVWHATMGHVAR